MASLTTILDMVKVMSFAIQEGKMAIHCHAGLGRTGKESLPLDHQAMDDGKSFFVSGLIASTIITSLLYAIM